MKNDIAMGWYGIDSMGGCLKVKIPEPPPFVLF
jgi:hypothetical protein